MLTFSFSDTLIGAIVLPPKANTWAIAMCQGTTPEQCTTGFETLFEMVFVHSHTHTIIETRVEHPDSRIQNPEYPDCSLQNPDSRIQILGSRIQTPDCRLQTPESRNQNPDSRIHNTASRIQKPDSRRQIPHSTFHNPEPRIQNPDSRIQIPKSRIQIPGSRLQNPESRIQNPASNIQNPHSRSTIQMLKNGCHKLQPSSWGLAIVLWSAFTSDQQSSAHARYLAQVRKVPKQWRGDVSWTWVRLWSSKEFRIRVGLWGFGLVVFPCTISMENMVF